MASPEQNGTDARGAVIAIGDVHGCADELVELLCRVNPQPLDTVVFLGDYIDRGPDSRRVVDTVLALRKRCNVVPLMGNHEDLFLEFLDDPESYDAGMFIYNGGGSTLASYGNDIGQYVIPDEHRHFYRELRLTHQTETHYFAHAGVPNIHLEEIDERTHRETLLWIRGRFLKSSFPWRKVIVHGHTRVEEVELKPRRINLDTACVYGGHLTAMNLNTGKIHQVAGTSGSTTRRLRDKASKRRAVRFTGRVRIRLRRGDALQPFETVNYSELGMYIRSIDEPSTRHFQVGQIVMGELGEDERSRIPFRARVVRLELEPVGYCYGVELLPER